MEVCIHILGVSRGVAMGDLLHFGALDLGENFRSLVLRDSLEESVDQGVGVLLSALNEEPAVEEASV